MSFNGKVVIVTGGSSGIGAATAIKFAEQGAKVTIVGRNEKKLTEVAKNCNNSLTVVADLTKDEDIHRIVNETIKRFGKIDILVNNAAAALTTSMADENAMEVYKTILATNLDAVVLLTHLAVPYIIKTKGNIINISSVNSMTVAYSAGFPTQTSKAALDHFTRSIASELAPSGVRVNSVNPGPVYTDVFYNLGKTSAERDGIYDILKKTTALKRISDAVEIADLILFLAGHSARGITGSLFVSDNGALVRADPFEY